MVVVVAETIPLVTYAWTLLRIVLRVVDSAILLSSRREREEGAPVPGRA
jgi:hypothetical protein